MIGGHLPSVHDTATDSYAWCGIERRQINLDTKGNSEYAARAPRDITFDFDSDTARRVASLGRTMYISGGQIVQFDGNAPVELGQR